MLFLILLLLDPTEGFNYEAGYEHHYTYSSTSDTLGMHNVTTVLKFRIQKINETNTGIKFHQLSVDSFVQHAQSGEYFLFEMEPDGLVHFIHYHQEDKTEMVTLKKALVGTMSAKFQVMHIDHSDNIREVKAFDNITMNGDAPATQRTLGSPLPVDRDVKVYSSGGDNRNSILCSQLQLIDQDQDRAGIIIEHLKVPSSELSDSVSDGLVRDSIVVTKKPPKTTTLKETGEIIKVLISCVQRHENKYAPNRTNCVRNLTWEISKLDKESFLQLSHSALNKTCRISDIKCLEERYLMIDVISQMRSNVSQQIIVDYVLERNTSVEEVRRCLIHSIATKQPIHNLVQAVEHLCLGKNHSFHEPFKGKFELKVDNLAFAEVNVGLIGKKFDIFKVSLCYKKKWNTILMCLRLYNMIIDPVIEAAKTIKELIEMVTEMTFVQLVKEIIKIFKNLPDIIHKIVESVVAAYNKLIDYDGYPLIDRFKKVINRVTNFITDVKSDVLGFYHSIADAMTVTLPFVAHEMGEGFILIKDSWKFWENPVQSFNGIEMALLKFKLAVATFIEAKNRIMDSCFFAKGQTPYWFHPVVEIKGLLTDLKDIYYMTKEEIHDIYHNPTASSSLSPDMITDGFNVNGSKRFIQETIKGVVDDINSTSSGVITLAKPFWEKISHLMDMFKKIKHAYTFLRDAYQKGKYYMQKLFGSKFHRKFPKTPASCGAKCGCGKYPRDNKGRKGVDLAFKPGYQVCIPDITKEEKV
ncbi:unnamed protein product [Mytilus edulis]|uniref:AP180 N-terminal homology (ANTH) domain-containing protein n=1 Tax=Mytilus edulis TaxID=6550 RepID=A0A8S3TX28_MYTED|nr:unnamed protein product [Mytilus edulis]